MYNPIPFGEEENKYDGKPVYIKEGFSGHNSPALNAVTKTGDVICSLLVFDDGNAVTPTGIKQLLLRRGYDISFCSWDGMGAMIVE